MSRSNQQQEQRSITDRRAKMGFGKYAHETVQDILDNAPEYLLWLDENTNIHIASDILAEAQQGIIPDHEFKNWTTNSESIADKLRRTK